MKYWKTHATATTCVPIALGNALMWAGEKLNKKRDLPYLASLVNWDANGSYFCDFTRALRQLKEEGIFETVKVPFKEFTFEELRRYVEDEDRAALFCSWDHLSFVPTATRKRILFVNEGFPYTRSWYRCWASQKSFLKFPWWGQLILLNSLEEEELDLARSPVLILLEKE